MPHEWYQPNSNPGLIRKTFRTRWSGHRSMRKIWVSTVGGERCCQVKGRHKHRHLTRRIIHTQCVANGPEWRAKWVYGEGSRTQFGIHLGKSSNRWALTSLRLWVISPSTSMSTVVCLFPPGNKPNFILLQIVIVTLQYSITDQWNTAQSSKIMSF